MDLGVGGKQSRQREEPLKVPGVSAEEQEASMSGAEGTRLDSQELETQVKEAEQERMMQTWLSLRVRWEAIGEF